MSCTIVQIYSGVISDFAWEGGHGLTCKSLQISDSSSLIIVGLLVYMKYIYALLKILQNNNVI